MTLIILVVTVAVSLYAFSRRDMMEKMLFNPYLVYHRKQWYRFFSSGLIHGDFLHLFVNMFVLFSLGGVAESYYTGFFGEIKGKIAFVIMYVGAMVFSEAGTLAKNKDNPGYNSLGASGAVSAVVFAYILFAPLDPLYLYGIIKLPGIVLGVGYLIFSAVMAKRGGGNINHDAHFYGAVFGFFFTLLMKPAEIGLHFLAEFGLNI